MNKIESHELKNRERYLKKTDRLSGYRASEGHHRHPPLQQIKPAEADDPASAGIKSLNLISWLPDS